MNEKVEIQLLEPEIRTKMKDIMMNEEHNLFMDVTGEEADFLIEMVDTCKKVIVDHKERKVNDNELMAKEAAEMAKETTGFEYAEEPLNIFMEKMSKVLKVVLEAKYADEE